MVIFDVWLLGGKSEVVAPYTLARPVQVTSFKMLLVL